MLVPSTVYMLLYSYLFLEWFEFWDQVFEYSSQPDYNISSFLAKTLNEPDNHGNFHRDNFFDQLMTTNQIAVVISDQSNDTKSVMVFRGNRDPFTWFSLQNLMSSSLWEITPESSSVFILFHSGGFEIWKILDNGYENVYFQVICSKNDENCSNEFADSVDAQPQAQLKQIGSLKIFVKNELGMNIEWNLQLSYTAESQINFKNFYDGNSNDTFNQRAMFRVPNLESELVNAAQILLRVHFDAFWSADLMFDVRKGFTTFTSWFSEIYLVDESFFEKIKTDIAFNFSDSLGSFLILEYAKNLDTLGCQNELWGLRVACKNSSVAGSCSVFEPTFPDEECQILFSKNWTSWEIGDYSQAHAFEIYTKPMTKTFSFNYSAFGIQLFDFYKTRKAYSGIQPVFRHHDFDNIFQKCNVAIMRLYRGLDIGEEYIFECGGNSINWFSETKLVSISNIENINPASVTALIEDQSFTKTEYFFQIWDKELYNRRDWKGYEDKVGSNAYCKRNFTGSCWHYYHGKDEANNLDKIVVSKMEIITDNSQFNYRGKMWQLVFSVDAYSGVHLYNYFREGSTLPAVPGLSKVHYDGIFRHPLLESRISKAAYIRFTVYDAAKNDAKLHLVFEPRPEDSLEDWFNWDRVVESSLWEFEQVLGQELFKLRIPPDGSHLSKHRFFNIQHNWTSCAGKTGWFLASIKFSEADATCADSWENWWENDQSLLNQPPAFFYSTTSARMLYSDMAFGGKITIEVIA